MVDNLLLFFGIAGIVNIIIGFVFLKISGKQLDQAKKYYEILGQSVFKEIIANLKEENKKLKDQK